MLRCDLTLPNILLPLGKVLLGLLHFFVEDAVEGACVMVTASEKSLRGYLVAVSPPLGVEGKILPGLLLHWDGMVAIPCIY